MDPGTGRWTQQDPLDNPSDLRQGNRYLCVGDEPINLVDPSGLLFDDIQSAIRGAVKTVVRKAIAVNGLICYIRKSTASSDV